MDPDAVTNDETGVGTSGTTTTVADEEPSTKLSTFAQLRANLEKISDNKNAAIASNIDDFYRRQKQDKDGDKKTKVEAAVLLRNFRGSVVTPADLARKAAPIKTTGQVPDVDDHGAANRAAAAMFVTSPTNAASSPTNTTMTATLQQGSGLPMPTNTVRSLAEFYQVQRRLRQQETMTRKQASELYRNYQGLLTSNKETLSTEDATPPSQPKSYADIKDDFEANSTLNDESAVQQGSGSAQNDLPQSSTIADTLNATTSQLDAVGTDNDEPVVLVDYKNADYRGFIFVVHENHGLLLLHCTRKAKKGPHYQLPGGHVDAAEFQAAARTSQDASAQLMIAAQMGAARELFEETGLDVRNELYRMEPAALRNAGGTTTATTTKDGKSILTCELKHRLYFFLPVTDDDFLSTSQSDDDGAKLIAPMTDEGSHLGLRLSIEHSGYQFEKDPTVAAKMLQAHSGGNGSKALLMAMKREEEEKIDIDTSLLSTNTSVDVSVDDTDAMEVIPGDAKHPPRDVDAPLLDLSDDVVQGDEGTPLIHKAESSDSKNPVDLNMLPPPKRKNIFSCCLWFET
ncbi:hypothetical protein MHU86_14259 [Fragilaria crotonensis]|nr:hypothetical protein MHU86_14259 [Fragilaria crotonensis]